MWVGVTTHKNPLGQLCLVSGLAFFWQLETARKTGLRLWRQFTPWIYLAMTAYLFYGGGGSEQRSSTAIVCLFMVVVIYLALGFFRSRPGLVLKSIIGGAVSVAVFAVILQFFGTSLQGLVAATQGKDATLTDRTYLWQDVIRIGMRSPILGSGYGGFWVPSIYNELSPEADNHPKEAHNGYLETFANLGLLGAGLLAVLLLQSLRSASKAVVEDFEYGRLRLAVLFMVLIMNYSEATFTVGNHLWWFGFLVVAVYANPWVYDAAPANSNLKGQPEIFQSEEESYIG
jgi:O-antigen ligase